MDKQCKPEGKRKVPERAKNKAINFPKFRKYKLFLNSNRMSLKNPNATKKCMRLPYAPLPYVFANMTPQQICNKQAALGDQIESWQEGYLLGYKSRHLEGWDASVPVNFQNGVNNRFVFGAKMLVARDNYNIVNKNDLGAPKSQ
jgi:hypothetical protein